MSAKPVFVIVGDVPRMMRVFQGTPQVAFTDTLKLVTLVNVNERAAGVLLRDRFRFEDPLLAPNPDLQLVAEFSSAT